MSTFVLLHRVREGTGCRIPIDLLTELEPVAESSGRKGDEGRGRQSTEIGSNTERAKETDMRARAGGRKTVIPERIERDEERVGEGERD